MSFIHSSQDTQKVSIHMKLHYFFKAYRIAFQVSYTIVNHYNVSRIKTELNVQYHFVSEQILDLGSIEIKSFQ